MFSTHFHTPRKSRGTDYTWCNEGNQGCFVRKAESAHSVSLCALSTSALAISSSSTVSVWPLSSGQSDALCSAVSLQTPKRETPCSRIVYTAPTYRQPADTKYSQVQRQEAAG